MSLKPAYRSPYEYSGPAISHRRVEELSAQENAPDRPTLCYYADKTRCLKQQNVVESLFRIATCRVT